MGIEITYGNNDDMYLQVEVMFEFALLTHDIENAFAWAKIKSRYDIQRIIEHQSFKRLFHSITADFGWIPIDTTPTIANGRFPNGIYFE